EVVAEVKHEWGVAQEIARSGDCVGNPQWSILLDERCRRAKLRAVPDGCGYLLACIPHDDSDVRYPRLNQLLDRIEDHGLVGDRNELLGVREGKRTEAASFATAEDEPLQRAVSTGGNRCAFAFARGGGYRRHALFTKTAFAVAGYWCGGAAL